MNTSISEVVSKDDQGRPHGLIYYNSSCYDLRLFSRIALKARRFLLSNSKRIARGEHRKERRERDSTGQANRISTPFPFVLPSWRPFGSFSIRFRRHFHEQLSTLQIPVFCYKRATGVDVTFNAFSSARFLGLVWHPVPFSYRLPPYRFVIVSVWIKIQILYEIVDRT